MSDINECAVDNAGCQEVCTNIPGSYMCSCNDGFQLDENKHNCSGMQVNYVYSESSCTLATYVRVVT